MKTRRAFTLIELLVVISIIAVLIAILLPALKKARETSWISICAANQHHLMIGLHSYSADADGHLTGRSGYNIGNVPNFMIQGTGDFADTLFYHGYATEPDGYYCPSGQLQAPTPLRDLTAFEFYHIHLSVGPTRAFFTGYMNYCNARLIPGAYEEQEIPRLASDDPDLVTLHDTNGWDLATRLYGRSQHPGLEPVVVGDGVLGKSDGLNVATLDGSVEWRPDSITEQRFPLFGGFTAWTRY